MADLTITAASVVPGSNATQRDGTAGETITAGMVLYQDATDNNSLKGAQHDDTEAVARAVGIALNGGADGQPIKYVSQGPVTLGAVLTAGVVYGVGVAAGGIAPIADAGSGDYVSILGIAISASVLQVGIQNSGVALT